jgi:cytochrome b subunit of formate dehydrogenase
MTTSFLIQNIAELYTMSSFMEGGKLNKNNTSIDNGIYANKQKNILISLLMILFVILLKGVIVYLLYNFMVPKIIYSLSENKSLEIIESNFKPISFSESVLLVILTNTLFSF